MGKTAQQGSYGAAVEQQLCVICGEGTAVRSLVEQEFQYGTGPDAVHLHAEVPVWSCSACELEYTDDDAEAARHAAVCRHLGRLTPAEIKVIRCTAAMTQLQFAESLNVGVASIKRWELGTTVQNAAYDTILREFGDELKANRQQKPTFRTAISPQIIEAASKFQLRPYIDGRLAA